MYNGSNTSQNTKNSVQNSKEVLHTFMMDHNFTKPSIERPPAIGEEQGHDDHSNSSISGKSEVSNSTPRRNDADLGYEPDGSASNLPSHEKWKISLHNLLGDTDGVRLFNEYLKEIKEEQILNAWWAMKGYQEYGLKKIHSANSSAASSTTGPIIGDQSMDEDTRKKRYQLARKIYHEYLDNDHADDHVKILVKDATKTYIRRQFKSSKKNQYFLDRDLFLQAQNEIERNVEKNSYKDFLISNIFKNLASQYEGVNYKVSSNQQTYPNQIANNTVKLSKPSGTESPSQIARQFTNLSVIPEEKEWTPAPRIKNGSSQSNRHVTPMMNSTTVHKVKSPYGVSGRTTSSAHPYYVGGHTTSGYQNPAPSAVGSDQTSNSKSSDTNNDDSSSIVEGPNTAVHSSSKSHNCRKERYHHRTIQRCDLLPPPPSHFQARPKKIGKMSTMATENPKAFFELLCEKLKVLEEKQKRMEKFRVQVRDTIDSNDILDSHLSRVQLESPQERPISPPPTNQRFIKRVRHPATVQSSRAHHLSDPFQQVVTSSTGVVASKQMMTSAQLQMLPIRNKLVAADKNQEVQMGVVPEITNNSVPDVSTPIIPVDKTRMISAWIQTPKQDRSRRLTKVHRQLPATSENSGEIPAYVNPVSSHNGPTSSSSTGNFFGPCSVLAQDPCMPLLDQPDAGTTIEEVKRRLIEETENFNEEIPDFMRGSHNIECTKKTGEFSEAGIPEMTTVLLKMPGHEYPYKITHPFPRPITLQHLKNYMAAELKVTADKFRFFFKKKSADSSCEFEEICKDGDSLPMYEGKIRAKLQSNH